MKTGPGISSPRSGWNLLEELSLGCMRKQPRAAPWVARPSPVPAPHRRPGFCPRGHVVRLEDTWLRSRGPRGVCVCVTCPVRCPRRARQRHGRRGGTFARVVREERARRRVENAPRMRRAQAARSASLPVPPSLSRSPESPGARRLGFCGSFRLDEFP